MNGVPPHWDQDAHAAALARMGGQDAGAPAGAPIQPPVPVPVPVAPPVPGVAQAGGPLAPVAIPPHEPSMPQDGPMPQRTDPVGILEGAGIGAVRAMFPGLAAAYDLDQKFKYKPHEGAQPGTKESVAELQPDLKYAEEAYASREEPPQRGGARPQGGGGGGAGDFGIRGAQGDLLGTYDAQKGAVRAEGDAIIGQSAVKAAGIADQAATRAAQAKDMAAFDAEVNASLDNEISGIRSDIAELRAAKVDPMALFNNASAGQKFMFVLASLGAAAGEAFSVANGGPGASGTFMRQLNTLMDRDIKAQESSLDNKKSALQMRQTLYGKIVEKYGRNRESKLHYQNMVLESAKMQLEGDLEKAATPILQAQAQRKIADIDQQQKANTLSILEQRRKEAIAAASAKRAADAAAMKARLDVMKTVSEVYKETGQLPPEARMVFTPEQIQSMQSGAMGPMAKAAGEGADAIVKFRADNKIDQLESIRADAIKTLPHKEVEDASGRKRTVLDTSKDIAGMGPGWENLRKVGDKVSATPGGAIPGYLLKGAYQMGVSGEGALNRQVVEAFFADLRSRTTGAGASMPELDRIRESAMGAQTKEEMWHYVQQALDVVDRRIDTANAMGGDAAQAEFQRRRSTRR